MDAHRSSPRFADPVARDQTGWRSLKQAIANRLAAPLNAIFGSRAAGRFGILMYHRITPAPANAPVPTWNVTPDRFYAQLSGLLNRGFHAWPLKRVVDYSQSGRPIPPKTFVVTIDDGYANNLTYALPVLRDLNIPATIFLATAYLNSKRPFPFDDWSAAGSPDVPPESWMPLAIWQCEELLASGLIELGAHTHTHGDFRNDPERLYADLLQNVAALDAHFGISYPTFAFPYGTRKLGYAGPELAAAARRAGVTCSLSTESELVAPYSDPFEWGRLTATDADTATTLAAKLDGWHCFVRETWHRLRAPFTRAAEARQNPAEHAAGSPAGRPFSSNSAVLSGGGSPRGWLTATKESP